MGEAIMKQDKDGQSPLVYHFWFSKDLNIDVIQLFVNKNPKLLQLKDHYQWLPLHHVVKHGKWDIIKYIIDRYPKALFEVDMIGLVPRLYADRKGRNKDGIWDKVLKEENKWYEVIKEKKKKGEIKENEYDFTHIGNLNDMMNKDYVENFEENRDKYMTNMEKDLFECGDIMNGKKFIKKREIRSRREEKFTDVIDNRTEENNDNVNTEKIISDMILDKKMYQNSNVDNRTENNISDIKLDKIFYIDDTIKEHDISHEDFDENLVDMTDEDMNEFIKENMGLDDKMESINDDLEKEDNDEKREKESNTNEKEGENNDEHTEESNVDNINIEKNANKTSEITDNKKIEGNNAKDEIFEENDLVNNLDDDLADELDEDLEEYDISTITDGWEEDVEAKRNNDAISP